MADELEHRAAGGRDWVAVVLAIGVATALNAVTLAAVLDAMLSDDPGLSENATQIITGAIGGVLGVLGSYVGFRAGAAAPRPSDAVEKPEPPPVTRG